MNVNINIDININRYTYSALLSVTRPRLILSGVSRNIKSYLLADENPDNITPNIIVRYLTVTVIVPIDTHALMIVYA